VKISSHQSGALNMRPSRRISSAVFASLWIVLGLSAGSWKAAAQVANQQYSAANIETGYRLYTAQCAVCHGANGDNIAGVNLARQQFRRASTDADIRNTVTNGVPAAGMPPFQFQPAQLDAIVSYIRSGFDISGTPFAVGDAARGKIIYDVSGCAGCHRVHGNGALIGPDLSDIGAIRKPAAIQLSLMQPSTAMQAINRPVRFVMRDGRTVEGRRLNEDTATVQLIDRQGQLVSLMKSDIRDTQLGTKSPMPTYAGKLFDREIADLLAYLLSLRG
jgi:putative heme-binding domain-containing protein